MALVYMDIPFQNGNTTITLNSMPVHPMTIDDTLIKIEVNLTEY